ncbi:hypothetical protein [Chitinophaga sp. 212800010-3]|uniref:hypothetical protein n=1 Tax=unclassified Chitinophaga TaxID=2619133 RepID=UPI002DF2AE64|nr:Cytochrome P450 [Chitinophaga sp. 212800010-3]
MKPAFDYLKIEKGSYVESSTYGLIQQLVKGVRFVRSQIPAEKIDEYMPNLRSIERKIQELEMAIGEPRIWYIEEIIKALKRE